MTDQDYHRKLDHYIAEHPGDQMAQALKMRGRTRITEAIVTRLHDRPASKANPTEQAQDQGGDQGKDGAFYAKRRRLIAKRVKLSNQFHECSTDGERAAVSKRIEAVEIKIRNMRDAAHADNPFSGMTGVELVRKLNSVRASISRYDRKLKNLKKDRSPEGVLRYEQTAEKRDQKLQDRNTLVRLIEQQKH